MVLKLGRYLEEQQARGRFRIQDTGDAADVLVGLVVGDQQVRWLFGSLSEPESAKVEARGASGGSISHAVRERLTRSLSGG